MCVFYCKIKKIFPLFFVLLGLIILSFFLLHPTDNLPPVWAASAHLFHPGIGTATINGSIEASEWVAADTYSLLMWNASSSSLTGTLYVMQSDTDLYLGFTVDDDEFTTGSIYGLYGDTLQFLFDDNNSGSLFEVGENKFAAFATDPWYQDQFFVNTTGSSNYDYTQTGGETNGEGMSGRQGSLNHFEVRFPLCSGDDFDFCLAPGDILGLQVKYYDVETSLNYSAYLYPGGGNTDLVTIEIIGDRLIYLPLILK